MIKDLNPSAASGQSRGQSSTSIEEMQKQLKVKDKVITELAGIVASLEINYGISIDDQTHTFQNFISIARSMEEEARGAGNATASSGGVNQSKSSPTRRQRTYVYKTLIYTHPHRTGIIISCTDDPQYLDPPIRPPTRYPRTRHHRHGGLVEPGHDAEDGAGQIQRPQAGRRSRFGEY